MFLSNHYDEALIDLAQGIDVVQTAINSGNFRTLTAALQAADLVSALQGAGPFTVFAPTDAAFQRLAAGTVENLLRPENRGRLAQILRYHVLAKSLTSSQIISMASPLRETTLEGSTLEVSRHGTHVRINNNVTVVQADVRATNGIIHEIDTVLMPPATSSATYFYLNQAVLFLFVCTMFFSSRRFF